MALHYALGCTVWHERQEANSDLERSTLSHSYGYALADDRPKLPLLLTLLTYIHVGDLLCQLAPKIQIPVRNAG